MGALNEIIGFFKGLFNLPALQEIKDLIYSGIMFVLYQDSVEGQSLTNIEVIDYVIRFGMLIIVWYGVIKIVLNVVWRILFGKPLLWKVGILEVFFGRLKPVYAQRMADITDAEIEEKTERYLESFNKVTKKVRKDSAAYSSLFFDASSSVSSPSLSSSPVQVVPSRLKPQCSHHGSFASPFPHESFS